MDPVNFPQANKTLTAPGSMPECGELPVFTDGKVCVSVWQLSFIERLRLIWYGRLWLFVWSGETQPPIGMIIDYTVFRLVDLEPNKNEEDDGET